MTLTNPTDEQLDAAFAEKVAGFTTDIAEIQSGRFLAADLWSSLPKYKSFDAVLPFLKKPFDDGRLWGVSIHRAAVDCMWRVTIREGLGGYSLYTPEHTGMDDSLAKAAVIALLRAHGVGVEFK